jgi:RNA polymerase sigma factor (sigma-70 family)
METTNAQHRDIIGRTYQEVRQELFSIFRQACIEEATCEDLIQEVFLKILRLDVIIEEQLKALAVTIAYQKRTDYLRHRAYINKVKHEGGWQMEQSYTNQEAEVNDILNIEMKVIRRMSVLDGKVYQMTRFEEKTADEIAMTLNLSKRAVESRLYRSRNQVRESVRQAVNL